MEELTNLLDAISSCKQIERMLKEDRDSFSQIFPGEVNNAFCENTDLALNCIGELKNKLQLLYNERQICNG